MKSFELGWTCRRRTLVHFHHFYFGQDRLRGAVRKEVHLAFGRKKPGSSRSNTNSLVGGYSNNIGTIEKAFSKIEEQEEVKIS